ncbi:hypothetical protein H8S90_16190 [Olivibacter sp. SDN3]|uniref:hypothetical protein n=1 Tax=Olivibacter sp. SDN3 TaxID=2764720 RepID=UPI001650FEB5|nr:hypothetical protein [Olivibacter sp. SDN3]QNL48329.1 hypothetical protein H8S90_16190 [Olivibacter sp. SDN3]
MKQIRITPLNIACASLAAWILWESVIGHVALHAAGMRLILVLVLAVADQFFRFFFKKMKQIWLVEIGFIVFTVLVVWVIGLGG